MAKKKVASVDPPEVIELFETIAALYPGAGGFDGQDAGGSVVTFSLVSTVFWLPILHSTQTRPVQVDGRMFSARPVPDNH